MQFAARNIITLIVLAVASIYAAPTTLERRGPYFYYTHLYLDFSSAFYPATNLQVSLRESKPKTTQWHFALVIHAPGGITDSGSLNTIHHHVINVDSKSVHFLVYLFMYLQLTDHTSDA